MTGRLGGLVSVMQEFRLLLFVRLQRVEGLLHQLSPEFFFFGWRKLGVAGHMDDSCS